MKIDVDGSGNIDWDEFSNYMFLERKQQRQEESVLKLTTQTFKDKNNPMNFHRGVCRQIQYVKPLDKYISSGQDGTFRTWHAADLMHHKTFQCSSAWITDSIWMPLHRLMVFASMDRSLSFYEYTRGSFELCGRVYTSVTRQDMGAPSCLTLVTQGTYDSETLLYGDMQGRVNMLNSKAYTVLPPRNLTLAEVTQLGEAHSDWVTQLKLVGELGTIASSGMDGCIKMFDFSTNRVRFSTRVHRKGCYGFAWCHAYSMIASCGAERDIHLSHGSTGRKIGVLQGHTSSVQHLVMHEKMMQLISISVDKVIKVWDLRNHSCSQTLIDEVSHRPENIIASVMFDHHRNRMVTCTTHPIVWPSTVLVSSEHSHQSPVQGAIYCKDLDMVVSADEQATVIVWDLHGGKICTFGDAHASRVSSMAFDTAGRRLLSASIDGTVRIHNYNNGTLLKNFTHNDQKTEVTDVLYVSSGRRLPLVVAVGWLQKVLIWTETTIESRKDTMNVSDPRVMSGHEEDILCLSFSLPNTLATADAGGRIIIWNLFGGYFQKVDIPERHL
ncbi:hypothetical protein CYMTET_24827 [Cymbomonas tetramitiformis]|uniref:EF-hand domain-containing protein n=1 Tax=Cymbomonas tetramitiformis TaxID=36881 RepID=A0AAE0FV35_9CHLO|nr:hypothetical protein CYMTET_24827 [Cymbomonas tetramitiformis]